MHPFSAFAHPPNVLRLRSPHRLPFRSPHRPPLRARPPTSSCPPLCTLRRALLSSRLPNTGHGAFARRIRSVRHPSLYLHTLTWRACTPPLAGLLIIPSVIWHAGWFHHLSRALSQAGVTVTAFDPLGAGRSDAIRGVRGLVLDAADHVDDACAAVRRLRREVGDKPVFVLGESGGGLTAALMMLRSVNEEVAGYVLCSPALRVKDELLPPAPVLRAMRILGRVVPGMGMPGDEVSGETWDLAFGDGACAELSKNDPYVGYGQPLRLGTVGAMLGAMELLETKLEKGEVAARNVLVAHNKGDRRTDFGHSKAFVERVRVDGIKRLDEPGGDRHQLFQDTEEVTGRAIEMVIGFVLGVAEGQVAVAERGVGGG